jgi:hypothetical protein
MIFERGHTGTTASESKMLTREESDKTIVKETANERRCPRCDAATRFVGQMLDSVKGRTIRMFRCHCGEQTSVSDPA